MLKQIGGILKPNDGKCHLDQRGVSYTHGLEQDYPSLGQIGQVARDTSMNVIFAVTQDVAGPYKKFEKLVTEFTTGILASDSANIVDLVKDQYKV